MAGGREPMKPDLRADESEETEGKGLECLRKARGREQRAAAQALQNHEWRAERSVILLEDVGPRHAVAHGIQPLDRARLAPAFFIRLQPLVEAQDQRNSRRKLRQPR